MFLGVLIVSSYSKVSRKRMYWELNDDSRNSAISNAISRNQFDEILKYLHFCNNDKLNPDDKFCKIRPLLDLVNERFLKNTVCNELRFDVDESMIPYFGRHPTKQ